MLTKLHSKTKSTREQSQSRVFMMQAVRSDPLFSFKVQSGDDIQRSS